MTLKIVVLIKQVPSYDNLEIDKSTGTIVRDGIENIINPNDLYSIELGLNLKEKYNAIVSIMTMGPPQAEFALREGLAMGADHAILISDPRFAYSDTFQTTLILKKAFEIIKNYDIIICGSQTSDSSTGQVPFQLSEALEIPLLTDFFTLEIENHIIKCHRNFGHESQNIEVELPILLRTVNHFNVLHKIASTHYLIHYHANNNCQVVLNVDNTPLPAVFECTYIRKDCCPQLSTNKLALPMELDESNVPHKSEYTINYPPFVFS